MKNKHNTPIEMIETWWEMKLPIFVARQFVRHRTATINEVSGRYITLPQEWYIPKPEHVGSTSDNIKQGRMMVDSIHPNYVAEYINRLKASCERSYFDYERALVSGVPAELARLNLHVNHYTHWVWKIDLHNLLNFLALRIDKHAQWEAQQYGIAMIHLLGSALPEFVDLFDKYRKL